eukprot:TRINITY_DN55541_c0_g1_i1.p1 TRINITY_DN55541_c0_g1~~TRINITY_DN55541_c0_g1_i1.p1  ORF type:complete len:276 (-),score=38.78 TRINITY_DN55541_c0_g1_i1:291-1118(-)
MGIKFPETSTIVAGGVGGPLVYFTVTPFRNACTLGATNASAGFFELYRQVFARGFLRGWTGGIYPSMYACPTFISLGPAYHAFKENFGLPGAVVLASITESMVLFGAETCNAQMATNEKAPGTIQRVHPSYKPFGPGIGIHISRNILATAGLRVFCTPCTWVLEKASGQSNALTTLGGDFAGNVISACLTAPIHQLYGYTVTTPELHQLSGSEKRARMIQFLKDQYLVTENGKTRLSATVPRDLGMRAAYVATLYTLYSTLERTVIREWPRWMGS